MSDPLVTIAVPSYNQGRYLEENLRSIFEQDIPMEVFVLDGGSSDCSLEVIRRWEHKLQGWRSHKDEGQAAAINEGIALGSAPYVCWLNSDDLLYPQGLKTLLSTLRENPDAPFVYGKCWVIDSSSQKRIGYLTMPFLPWLFANFCFVAQPSTLIRRDAWESLNGLEETMDLAFDYDMWWRLYNAYGAPIYSRTYVAATRAHSETKTATQVDKHYKESRDLVIRHYGNAPMKWKLLLPVMKAYRAVSNRTP